VSKIDLAYAPAPRAVRWNGLRLFRRVARALLCALQDSRGRTARRIIHDYRYLLPEQAAANSFQEGRKGMATESQRNLKGIARE
jgi:hypothetical protein